MNIVVPIKLVPDLVEELAIDQNGTGLDTAWLRSIINEFDEHAMEQAILLKEQAGGQVTIVAPDVEGVDDVLYTAAARGADRLIKLSGEFGIGLNNHSLARALAEVVKQLKPDLVLTGVQAHNDLDGSLGPLLAEFVGFAYLGYVAGVKLSNGKALARKEYPGGLVAEMDVILPAVLAVQAAEKPPRYVPVSRIRQAMQSASIESQSAAALDPSGSLAIGRMFHPEVTERATMIEGDPEDVAAKLLEIFKQVGLV